MEKKEIFYSKKLNENLEAYGYVVVPFLEHKQIDELNHFYAKLPLEQREVFTTFASNDFVARRTIDAAIKEISESAFNALFKNYEAFWANFFVKQSSASAMPLHADLQYVNEPKELSVNLWCPLMDTNVANGTLGIVPASHKVVSPVRGTNVTNGYRKYAAEIGEKMGIPIELKAGEAIVYDHRLLHFSYSNTTKQNRVAITIVGVPKNTPLVHFYADSEESTTIEQYSLNSVEDLLQTPFLGRPPHLQPTAILKDFQFKPIRLADFELLRINSNLP